MQYVWEDLSTASLEDEVDVDLHACCRDAAVAHTVSRGGNGLKPLIDHPCRSVSVLVHLSQTSCLLYRLLEPAMGCQMVRRASKGRVQSISRHLPNTTKERR